MNIDLHCHSTASDGKLDPLEVLKRAVAANVDIFSLTDHDTLSGTAEILASDDPKPKYLISGVELSTQWQGAGIHILGLDFSLGHDAMLDFIANQRKVREERAQVIDQRLAKKGMPHTLRGALNHCPDIGQVGRPHFAEAMLEAGYVSSMNQAFDRWLGNGKIGDVKSGWPEMHEAVTAINLAGGVAVLAHPLKYKMTFTKLKRLMLAFAEAGGGAVEVVGQQSDATRLKQLQEAVAEYDLGASGGSDFHDPNWAWSELGRVQALPARLKPVWQLFKQTKISENN